MNVFAGQSILLPNELREHFQRFAQTRIEGSSNRLGDSPFPRMVDFWFAGLTYAVKLGLKPTELEPRSSYNAIEGNVFGSDNFRSDMIILFCISKTGSLDILSKPPEMLRFANSYAVAGLRELISRFLNSRGDEALDFFCETFSKLEAE